MGLIIHKSQGSSEGELPKCLGLNLDKNDNNFPRPKFTKFAARVRVKWM